MTKWKKINIVLILSIVEINVEHRFMMEGSNCDCLYFTDVTYRRNINNSLSPHRCGIYIYLILK